MYFHRARIQAHPERPPSEALSYSELTDSLHYTQEAKLSSRVWQIICVPTSDYAVSQRTWVPWMVLMGGLVMTALTALLFFEQSSRANVLQTINLSLREEISGRKQAEAQMLHVQKLDAIGELAGGIAHDFNNILSGIMGYALLVRDELHQPEEARKDLDQIMKAGNRAKELIGQILVFSRRSAGELKKSSQPLGPILQDAIKLIRPTLPKTIEISFKENAKPLVSVDATRIYQVIVNLCVNAGQAMPTGGKLKILLEEAPIEESPTWMIDDPVGARTLKSGRYAMITVQDTGTGISKEVLPRIFEPYFTTKGVGQGTGMGLSVAYGIVQQHGGDIRVYSEVGKGTTFKIFLPVVDSSRAIVMPEEIGELRGGHESILVVDDEEMLVNMVAKHLGRLGYKVSSFTHGPTALEAFKKSPSAFDLVISDLSMPELTGDKFAEEAGKLRPDLPIILCSGFVDVISPQRQSELRIWKVVTKPFIGPDLQREVRRALDSAQKKSSAGALAN
ncbi:MAG: response regulator [Verrucomicrobiae bacterium]|nr:response regulator [Verrucomicrobiae bacterium]